MQRIQRPLLLAIDQSGTLSEQCEQAGRAMSNGFDSVEWSLLVDSARLQSSISQLESIPIRVVAMRCEMLDIPSAVQFVFSRLQAASSLRAKVLNLSLPFLRRGNVDGGFARYPDTLNFAHELLHRVRFEAEASGVTVALEAATGGCFLSPIEMRELIDNVNSSAIGVCVDVERIIEIGSPLDWIHTLHRRIQAVRCMDVPGPGLGVAVQTRQLPIEPLIQALDEIAMNCPLILSRGATENVIAVRRCDG